VGESFERACSSCGISGSGPTTRKAHVSFLKARLIAGERFTAHEEALVGYSPAPWGTAASSCPSSVVVAVGEA
jgi:hypothetical protein